MTTPIRNVVLVHGAFADGSGWRNVYSNLTARGYAVTIVQNPLTSLADDVAATTRALNRQNGPAILVGHSWGGTVITEAGNHPNVAGLVYVAALVPASRRPPISSSILPMTASAPSSPKSSRSALPPISVMKTPPSCVTRRCRSTCPLSAPG